ncbi:DUF4097 family beta strand repeat-containing protein [Streptomyces sp. NPDC097619]|uniref:DUF4097 family beta strand repeat-containing protein n=1 Tax=Streptomyces sp. NPDC097619 TaxID=3157228 RepID=UPI003321E280
MQQFATPTPIAVVLDVPAALIRLTATDRPDTTVDIRPADTTKTRDAQAAQRIDTTYTDGVLHITAAPHKNLLGSAGTAEITLQLPTGSHLAATTATTDLRTTGHLGEVTLDSAHGTLHLHATTGARITLQAGDITLTHLTGPAELITQKGDITVTEAHQGTVTLRTEYGHITIGTARGTSASLDAGTAHGRIHNALTNTAPTPTLTLHATTTHGDIKAHTN